MKKKPEENSIFVFGKTTKELQDKINEKITAGYVPVGSVFPVNYASGEYGVVETTYQMLMVRGSQNT